MMYKRTSQSMYRSFRSLVANGVDGHSSSQGVIGRIAPDEFNSRLKGFLNEEAIASPQDVARFNTFLGQGKRYLNESGYSRLTLRVLARDAYADQLDDTEAVLPLQNGFSIVYVGYNEGGRRFREEQTLHSRVAHALSNANRHRGGNFVALSGLLRAARREGITVGLVSEQSLSENQLEDIGYLMRFHGYDTEASVHGELSRNRVAAAFLGERIIGISMGEAANVGVQGGNANIVELTNATIHPDFRQPGEINRVYAAVTTLLVTSYAGENSVIYSESNATKSTVLAVRAMQGGIMGGLDRVPQGILDQHVRMRTSNGNAEFYPLAVNYLLSENISRLAGADEIRGVLDSMRRE